MRLRVPASIHTFPRVDRMHWLGWLPETTITDDPSEVADLYRAIDPNAKYLLHWHVTRYQELYRGEWIQYRIDLQGLPHVVLRAHQRQRPLTSVIRASPALPTLLSTPSVS